MGDRVQSMMAAGSCEGVSYTHINDAGTRKEIHFDA